MASATRYAWTRSDGTTGRAWRAVWAGGSKRGFALKGEAIRWAQDREAEQRHGVVLEDVAPTGRMTVEQWGRKWLEGLQVRPGTMQTYEYALKRINAQLGARTLVDLRPSQLRDWRKGLTGDGRLSPSTADLTANVLAMLLRSAVLDGLLPASPMPPSRGGTSARVVDPSELLTIDQVLGWDEALPAPARGMAVVAAMTGLRQGELLGLRPERVDFLRRQVRVQEQLLTHGAGQPVWGPPKTAAGVRTVPLPELAATAMAEHMRLFPSPAGEPVWLNARGGRWRRGTFGDTWRVAKDRAGLPDWAHWHALRDVALSAYVRAGVDVRTVMTIAGHASPDETLRVYARLWEDSGDDARRAVDSLWDRSEVTRPARQS